MTYTQNPENMGVMEAPVPFWHIAREAQQRTNRIRLMEGGPVLLLRSREGKWDTIQIVKDQILSWR